MLRVNPKSTSYHGPFCVIPDRRRRRRLLLRAVLRDYPQGRLLRRPLPRSHQGYRVPRLLGAGGEGGGGKKTTKSRIGYRNEPLCLCQEEDSNKKKTPPKAKREVTDVCVTKLDENDPLCVLTAIIEKV